MRRLWHSRRARVGLSVTATWALLLLAAPPARAQPLGNDGDPIVTNDYAIDLTQGPVLASTRVMGLAGAYVAIAEFTEGNTQNPAAPAVRTPYSFDHVDYDIALGLTFPSTLRNSDFFNTGKRGTGIPETEEGGFVFFELSGNVQYGGWGIGAATGLARYSLARSEDADGEQLSAEVLTTDIQVARQFLDGQLIGGLGLRIATLQVQSQRSANASEANIFSTSGAAPELGLLLRPDDQPFRVGAAFRAAVRTTVDEATTTTRIIYPGTEDELFLPSSVELPWEFAVGAAYQFGKPLNPRWYDPARLVENVRRYVQFRRRDRERRRYLAYRRAEKAGGDAAAAKAAIDAELTMEAALDEAALDRAHVVTRERLVERYRGLQRFYLLFSAGLLVRGRTEDAVGVESFLERIVNRSGQNVTYSPRLGVESEVVPDWVTLRAGSYLEPTRFRSNPELYRPHWTAGLDVKIGKFSGFGIWPDEYAWRLRGAVDFARDYLGWGIAIGGWY